MFLRESVRWPGSARENCASSRWHIIECTCNGDGSASARANAAPSSGMVRLQSQTRMVLSAALIRCFTLIVDGVDRLCGWFCGW